MAFDGDAAGQAAILRAGKMAEKIGLEIRVINNRTGLDPDEVVNKYGADELKAMLAHSLTWMDFILDYYQKQYDLNNYSAKKEYVSKVCAEINKCTDELDKDVYLRKLAEITGFTYDILRKEKVGSPTIVKAKNRIDYVISKNLNGLEIAQRTILKQLMLSAANVGVFQDEMVELPDEKYNRYITLIINSYFQNPQFKIASLAQDMDDQQYSMLLEILADKSINDSANADVLRDCCIKLKIASLQKEKEKINQEITKLNDGHLKAKLSLNYINIQKEIKELKEKLSTVTGGRNSD